MTATLPDRVSFGDPSRYFVPRGRMSSTLFRSGGTATGEFRPLKHGIVFYDGSGSPRFALVTNPFGERFFVSASRVNGRIRYLFALTDRDRDWAGIPDDFAAEREIAVSVAASFGR